MITKVYKFGCRRPDNEALALQLLGQAFNYREDLRREMNACTKAIRSTIGDDAEHVREFYRRRARASSNGLAGTAICRIRGERGHLIDWGTYCLVEEAINRAAKASGLDPIKPARWDGTGSIGATIAAVNQFQASDWGSNKRVSLTEPDAKGHAELTIVIGDLKDARAVKWPIKLHRPFPEGAVVKQAAVQRIRVGWRFRWEALVTIAYAEASGVDAKEGIVGVDLGWRRHDENMLQVATCSDGKKLSTDVLDDLLYSDEVRGTRDRLFDDAKKYVKEQKLPGHEHVHLWKDKARMLALASSAQDFGLLWWVYRDRHLEDIEANVRDKAIRRRKDLYRCFADSLAKRYRTVVLEDMSTSDFDKRDTHAQERRKAFSATHELQQAIIQRLGKDRVLWVDPYATSASCSECGAKNWHIGSANEWTCPECGEKHDRDVNAAKNIERLGAEGKGRSARTAKPKKKKEKKARAKDVPSTSEEASREPIANAAE